MKIVAGVIVFFGLLYGAEALVKRANDVGRQQGRAAMREEIAAEYEKLVAEQEHAAKAGGFTLARGEELVNTNYLKKELAHQPIDEYVRNSLLLRLDIVMQELKRQERAYGLSIAGEAPPPPPQKDGGYIVPGR